MILGARRTCDGLSRKSASCSDRMQQHAFLTFTCLAWCTAWHSNRSVINTHLKSTIAGMNELGFTKSFNQRAVSKVCRPERRADEEHNLPQHLASRLGGAAREVAETLWKRYRLAQNAASRVNDEIQNLENERDQVLGALLALRAVAARENVHVDMSETPCDAEREMAPKLHLDALSW